MNDKWDVLKNKLYTQIDLIRQSNQYNEQDQEDESVLHFESVLKLMRKIEQEEQQAIHETKNKIEKALLNGEARVITVPSDDTKGIKQLIEIQNLRLKRLEERDLLVDVVKDLNQTILKLIGQLKVSR